MNAALTRVSRRWRGVLLLVGVAMAVSMFVAASAWAVETRGGDRIEVGPGEVVNDDLYATGSSVVVDGTVKGDLVAFGNRVIVNGTVEGDLISAAQAVEINGTVEDDARIAGQALVLGEDASISDDVFAGGVSLEGRPGSTVGGSVYYGGYQALLAGTIDEKIQAGLTALELGGETGGNVNAEIGDVGGATPPRFVSGSPVSMPTVQPGLTLTDSANIGGDLTYTSSEKGNIAGGANVAGDVSREDVPSASAGQATPSNTFATAFFDHLRRFVTLLLVGGLALWAMPRLTQGIADRVKDKPFQSLGWGAVGSAAVFAAVFVGLIAAVLVAIVFGLLTLGGVAFWAIWAWVLASAVLVAAYLVSAAYLAPVVVALAGGRLLFRSGQRDPRIMGILALAAGLLIYVVLRSIPIVGTLTGLVVVLLGVGAISYWLWTTFRTRRTVTAQPSVNGPTETVVDKPIVKN